MRPPFPTTCRRSEQAWARPLPRGRVTTAAAAVAPGAGQLSALVAGPLPLLAPSPLLPRPLPSGSLSGCDWQECTMAARPPLGAQLPLSAQLPPLPPPLLPPLAAAVALRFSASFSACDSSRPFCSISLRSLYLCAGGVAGSEHAARALHGGGARRRSVHAPACQAQPPEPLPSRGAAGRRPPVDQEARVVAQQHRELVHLLGDVDDAVAVGRRLEPAGLQGGRGRGAGVLAGRGGRCARTAAVPAPQSCGRERRGAGAPHQTPSRPWEWRTGWGWRTCASIGPGCAGC
jgi:hypothetical protein